MIKIENKNDLVEYYLADLMTEDENTKFENQLKTDQELQKAFEFSLEVEAAICIHILQLGFLKNK